jgi:hypothetical protein
MAFEPTILTQEQVDALPSFVPTGDIEGAMLADKLLKQFHKDLEAIELFRPAPRPRRRRVQKS